MGATLAIHIIAGGVGLVSGYIALYSAKGAPLHRKAGIIFVYAMLSMCVPGLIIAIGRNVAPAINVPAAILTSALVITALTAVRPLTATTRFINRAATVATLGVGVVSMTFAMQALANGGKRNGMPAVPFVMFGVVGLLATAGDFRLMRSGALEGPRRIARHLWRMTFALFIAALSFFIGQAQVIPKVIRIPGLLALPVLAVFFTMLYWLWRVRFRRRPVVREPLISAT